MHILIVLYVAYILPVRVAFEEEETWGDYIIDIMFMVDVFAHFFLPGLSPSGPIIQITQIAQ